MLVPGVRPATPGDGHCPAASSGPAIPAVRGRGVPNASFKTWLAAAPAMIIMEPMATYCRIIAMRSLLQFLRHHLGLGAKVVKVIGWRDGHGTAPR